LTKGPFVFFCIVIMLSLIQLGSIRDNLSPDSFRYSREDLPYIETHKKPQYQNDVCQGGKEKKECPRECPFAGSFSRGAYFTAKRNVFSNIVPKLLQSFRESAFANLVSFA